jgi:hypothetical protein
MMPSEVIVTYLNIVLYALSYQLQRPIEPFLIRSLIHTNNLLEEEESTAQTYGRYGTYC